MAINSNFSIYEPEAWVEVYLANQFPMRPMVSQSVTNVAGADVEGLVAAKNKAVNITRAVKSTTSDVIDYTGNYASYTTPDADEFTLTINKQKYLQFSIDKADQRFALPDLVEQHFVPRLHSLLDVINQDVKAEALKFEAAFADLTGNATVLDTADLIEARRILKSRKNYNEGTIAVLSPQAEADLLGLSLFQQANTRGGAGIQLEGAMGRAFGFDFFVDNLGSAFTPATVTDAVVAANAAAGAKTLTIDNGSGSAATESLVEGDVIYFGTASTTDDYYVVQSQTGTVLTLKEGLRKAVLNNATINAVPVATAGTATNEFFYDPKAIALVTAVMQNIDAGNGGVRRAAGFEPTNRVNYTLTIEETKAGADILIEVLYGVKLFYPDLGVRYVRGPIAKS
jgi:hypothetical protein